MGVLRQIMLKKLKHLILGKPKDPLDPNVFHNVSLIAFFAWVGLGADGLSSSCYGPEEAFHALGSYAHLALPMALAVAVTVFLLSATYSQIIELFPNGGGGYMVASKLLGPQAGLFSGCALLVDYVLTVAISVASSMDAIFSFLPSSWLSCKFGAVVLCLLLLVALNLRGVKESILVLTPIFILFLVTHAFLIVYGILHHGSELPALARDTVLEIHAGVGAVGFGAMALIFLKAFSLGGGTFTGIEAVSNGLQILREPRVATGKRTMLYMSLSLAFTAGGILVNYILNGVHASPGQTLNAVLIHNLADGWPLGKVFITASLLSEGALLLVAAQAGFLAGPRVMANMAVDNWLPRRFNNLSDRLVIKDGVLVMGIVSLAVLFYTRASVKLLVVMYSINVFITFTFSQFGVSRYWIKHRGEGWRGKLAVMLGGLILTTLILIMTSVFKFREGGWVTLLLTGLLAILCRGIRSHYDGTGRALKHLDAVLTGLPVESEQAKAEPFPGPTAFLLVSGYNGIGVHSFLAIHGTFPKHFKNFVFLSVGVLDSGRFKGAEEVAQLEKSVRDDLDRYVRLARGMGFYAASDAVLDTDPVDGIEILVNRTAAKWRNKKVIFAGQLTFEKDHFWSRFLHNQTCFSLQRRLIFLGHQTVILPLRIRRRPPMPAFAWGRAQEAGAFES